MLAWWIVLLTQFLSVVIGHHIYSSIDMLTGKRLDCLHPYLGTDFFESFFMDRLFYHRQPKEQLSPFCLVVKHGNGASDDQCHSYGNVGWSFDQLKKRNITGHHLVRWNAPVQIIDEYERFLHTGDKMLLNALYCNCTDGIHFGDRCQYAFDIVNQTFDTLLEHQFRNFLEAIPNEDQMIDDKYITCYKRDVMCREHCLDWRHICNGIVDCFNGEDEISCYLLELNECLNNEYRCRSGYCIPMEFAFDMTFDCDDGTDERELLTLVTDRLDNCYRHIPHMFCDDFNSAWMMFPCGDGQLVDNPLFACNNRRTIRSIMDLHTSDNTTCWQYMVCAQYYDHLYPLLVNCTTLCGESNNCLSLVTTVCPGDTVFFPPRPIMLHPSVYLAYQTNRTKYRFEPELICYSDCDHLYPPSSIKHGYSCRSLDEFKSAPFHVSQSLQNIATEILYLFAGCITHVPVDVISSLVSCPLTNRLISRHRVKDGLTDCHLRLDETLYVNTCSLNITGRFQCWTKPNECIPQQQVQDQIPDCSDSSDEFYPFSCSGGTEIACDYARGIHKQKIVYYQFQVL
jgi:hypothetical protein